MAVLVQSAHAWPQQEQQEHQQSSQLQQQALQPRPSTPPSSQPEASNGPKPKKVWTNEDVTSLRSPTDIYLAEKEAQEAAHAEAAAKRADLERQIKEAGLTMELPPTTGETQQSIKTKEERTIGFEQRLDLLNDELSDAESAQKAAIRRQIETVTSDLKKIHLEIKVLRSHLEDLSKNTPGERRSVPPALSSPQNMQ
ncbi:MAG: hypothetical protein WA829_15005 [Candidatus Acidiferrum sp.]